MKTQKGQKWLFKVGTLAVCFMLTGCGHEHTWNEATCTEPRTCSECGETEGEALGHTWVDATCAEAKHCSVCGETEGEPLEHTWVDATCAEPKHCSVCGATEGEPLEHTLTEANYQQAAICEVCGKTVGEPLQAEFEKYGLVCDAEQNIEYKIVRTSASGMSMTINGEKIVFSDYNVFDSDDTHEALEGYEWRAITMTMSLNITDSAYLFNDGQLEESFFIPALTDYYCNFANTYNESTETFSLNYNGTDYPDIKIVDEVLKDGMNGDIYTIEGRYYVLVPKGYDGIVVAVAPESKLYDGNLVADNSQLNDDNVFFRLK